MQSGNPALRAGTFERFGVYEPSQTMSVHGTATKTFILLTLAVVPAIYTWSQFLNNPQAGQAWMFGGLAGGLVMALITIFRQQWAPVTAPMYAFFEGLFLGAISAMYNTLVYPGIVFQAICLTFGTLFSMLLLYQMGWVRATEKFKLGVLAATGGIALVYLVSIVLNFFGSSIPMIHGNGVVGIAFSVFVVVVAALNLVLDFDFIEQGAERGAPKYMEWYGAFGLMVTLVWLYLEVLRLLSKLNSRR